MATQLTKQNEGWEQLSVLRKMTEMSGILHEAQRTHLVVWPRLAFPHSTRSAFGWDPDAKEIEFHVTLGPQKAPADLKKRVDALVSSTKALLGDQWLVRILVKGHKSTEFKHFFSSKHGKGK